jgi:rubrerythrin
VTDGAATIGSEVTVQVAKKEKVTVSDNSWMTWAAVAMGFMLVAVGILVVMTRRRSGEEATGQEMAGATAAEGADARIASIPPLEAAPEGVREREEAQKRVVATEELIADYLELNPDDAAGISTALENMEIARQMLDEGEYGAALRFARDAQAAVHEKMRSNAAAEKEGEKRSVGKLECPGCGEELQAEWTACPVCGHQTR